jgi:hypothetical protein
MAVVVVAALAVTPWQSLDAAGRTAQLDRLSSLPVEARFVAATEGFLGTRYVLSPLGEGRGVDGDPLLRYDAADCVTMVESAMALALSATDEEVLPTLNRIRYASEPSYEGRLHVMEAQWLPVNVSRGYLEDVTRALGQAATRRVSKRIGEDTWREKSGASLGLPEVAQVKGVFELDLVPAEVAPRVLATAPDGLVVVVVRADRPRLVSRITHVGVLVQKASGPHLRHASRSFKRVVDEPVERYLRRNLEFGAWTVEGVSLYRVRAPVIETPAATVDAGIEVAVDAGRVEAPGPLDAGPVATVTAPARSNSGCGCHAGGAGAAWVLLGALMGKARRRRALSPRG